MKKIKNLFFAVLVAGVMLPVLDATTDPDAVLDTFTVDGTNVTCVEADGLSNYFSCTTSVSWKTTKVTIVATPKSGAELDSNSSTAGEITLTGDTTSLLYLVKVTGDENKTNTYSLEITKEETPTPKLSTLSVKLTENGSNLITFSESTHDYNITVPYGTTEVFVNATPADQSYTIGGISADGKLEVDRFGGYVSISVSAGDKTEYYSVNIDVEDNPIIEEVNEKLADKGLNVEFSDIYDGVAEFGVINYFDGGDRMKIDLYTAPVSEDKANDADAIVEIIENAIKSKPLNSFIYNFSDKENVLTEEMIKIIKDSAYDVLVFGQAGAWIFNGSKLTNDFKDMKLDIIIGEDVEEELRNKVLGLIENKEKGLVIDIKHNGKLPAGTKVKVGVDAEMFSDEELTLYLYNTETGKLNVVAKKLKVQSDDILGSYVEFELDHASTYVLTTSVNNAQTGVLNVVLYSVLAIGSLVGIIFLLKKKAN